MAMRLARPLVVTPFRSDEAMMAAVTVDGQVRSAASAIWGGPEPRNDIQFPEPKVAE